MSPPKREYILFLEDMLQSMLRIQTYIEESDFKAFEGNFMAIDAVVRNFEIIGEASKNVPDRIKVKYPEIPWKKMVGLRNLISHEYIGIDIEMIWEIAKYNLPENQQELKRIIASESNSMGSELD